MLSGLLKESNIITNLTATTKEEAIKELFNALDFDFIDNRQELLYALLAREAISSTGIGKEMAIANAKSAASLKTQISLGISKKGINWNSIDFDNVKLIFLVVTPMKDRGDYLSLTAKLGKMLRSTFTKEKILANSSKKNIVKVIKESEMSFL